MKLSQRILNFLHPQSEGERVKVREAMSRALAEAEDVAKTIELKRDDICKQLRKEERCVVLQEVVSFEPFSEICEYRYFPKDSLMRLCKNPAHDAHATGIASCNVKQCPKFLEASSK